MKLALLYTLFAVVATFANIASQELSLLVYRGSQELIIAIMVGTGAGLVVKYLLDRRYIFRVADRPLNRDTAQFLAYAATGLLTTIIFWGTELAFDMLFATREARYAGAVLGLACGYIIKYQLDRHYVFTRRTV